MIFIMCREVGVLMMNESWNEKAFGRRLKGIIKKKRFTQEKFAEELGISVSTLKNYFSGKSSPSLECLRKMKKLLNLKSIDDLFTERGDD